jgi:hypothetical protein
MKDGDNHTEEKKNVSATKNMLKAIYVVVGAVIFLFVSYHGLNSYIDWRIENRIKNADFLREVARRVRPSLVFDDKGSIIADMGAIQYISDIKVSEDAKDSIQIIIIPNEYLGIEPVLEALDAEYSIHAERGTKFDWIFKLYAIQQLVAEPSPQRRNERFRLELIR